jgi:hypothetical protein
MAALKVRFIPYPPVEPLDEIGRKRQGCVRAGSHPTARDAPASASYPPRASPPPSSQTLVARQAKVLTSDEARRSVDIARLPELLGKAEGD